MNSRMDYAFDTLTYSEPIELTTLQLAVIQGNENQVVSLIQTGSDINETTTRDIHLVYNICNKCVCDIKDRSYNTATVSDSDDQFVSRKAVSKLPTLDIGAQEVVEDEWTSMTSLSNSTETDSLIKYLLLQNANISSQIKTLTNTIKITFCCRTDCEHENEGLDPSINDSDDQKQVNLPKGSTVLHLAVLLNSLKTAERLLALGARADLENSQSHSMLHLASKLDNVDMLRLLLKHGYDINKVNSNKDHPLHTAVAYGSLKAIQFIVNQPVLTDSQLLSNRFGKHPIHIAIQNNNATALRLLLTRFKPFPRAPGYDILENALHFAIIHNSPECGQALIDAGYNVNACDSFNTPLIRVASRYGLHLMTSLLLVNGAKVHTDSNTQLNALDMALEMTYLDQMVTLLSAGATFNPRSGKETWTIEQLDMRLCISSPSGEDRAQTKEKFVKLLQFGYKFSKKVTSLGEKQENDIITRPWDEIVEVIQSFSRNPLPMQRLAANCILRNLYPNAWVSIQQLPLPRTILEYVIQYQHKWD